MRRIAFVLLLALAACGDDPVGVDLRAVAFDPRLGVDLDTFVEHPSGIFYRDVKPGEGDPVGAASRIDVGIEGWLPNGIEVQGWITPPTLTVGTGQVIPGLDIALVGMREGGERLVVVPPDLAWKDGNVMVFRLVLLAVR